VTTAKDIVIDNVEEEAELKKFLVGPEVETLVRRLYDCAYLKETGPVFDATRSEFQGLFNLHFEDRKTPTIDAGQLFDRLRETCKLALQQAIGQGELSALDATSAIRHRTLLARFDDIQANLEFLRRPGLPSPKELSAFRRDYLADAKERFGYLIPPSVDQQRKIQIDKLFVHPQFHPDSDIGLKERVISTGSLVHHIHRTVVLGSPGGGKTTFARKLVHLLASSGTTRPVAGRRLTPFLVTLKQYAAEKARSSMSVLQFIETRINADHQISPPHGAIELFLRAGMALVIFDGLDELLESVRRKEIRDDVESFSRRYPETAVLVTSREVGYLEAPLDADVFNTFRIAEFSHSQIKDYARKWFVYEKRQEEADVFVSESETVPDLRENPMLLALLCTLYRGPGTLPRKRPDIYERCSKMLFEQWDTHRGIRHPVPYPNHLFWAMQHLAYSIYADPALSGGITERQLIKKTQDYLLDRCTEDVADAEVATQDFVAFCRGRAWVFTDTGQTANDEPIYEFTHRTFLEYFAARHLARNYPSPDALADILIPRIKAQEWDMVAQLAFHALAQDQSEAADRLVERLITSSESDNKPNWTILNFAGLCLRFLTPRPKTVKQLTHSYIKWWFLELIENLNKGGMSEKGEVFAHSAWPYLNALPENLPAVAEVFEKKFSASIVPGAPYRERIAEIALKIEFHLQLWFKPLDSTNFWTEFSRSFCEHHLDLIEDLARDNLTVARTKPCGIRYSPTMCWKHFGFDSLYNDISSFCTNSHRIGSYVENIYRKLDYWVNDMAENEKCSLARNFADSEELAQVILNSPVPWADKGPRNLFTSTFDTVFQTSGKMGNLGVPIPMVFVMFCFFAYAFDAQLARGGESKKVLDRLNMMIDAGYHPEFARCALARTQDKIMPSDLDQRFEAFFSSRQYQFICSWIQGEISLVSSELATNNG